jgi:CBS-domain-containing membrane protein
MKKMILTATMLLVFAGMCFAEMDQDCYDRCMSQSNYGTDSNATYCKGKCSNNQVDYREQQLDLQRQQLEIQKQSLELQKQQLELQRQQQAQLQQPAQQNVQAQQAETSSEE